MNIIKTNDYGAVTGWKVIADNGTETHLVTWKDEQGRLAVAEDASTVSFFSSSASRVFLTPEDAIKKYMNPAVRPVKGK